MIRFTRIDGEHRGAKHIVKKIPILIGRAPDADLRLNPHRDLDASARHAEVYVHEGGLYLRDLGSRNGTYLNGRRLGAPGRVRSGDEIELGYGGPRFRLHVELRELDAPRTEPGAALVELVDEMAATIVFAPERSDNAEEPSEPSEPALIDDADAKTIPMEPEVRDALLAAAHGEDEEVSGAQKAAQYVRDTELRSMRSEAAATLHARSERERDEVMRLERENRRLRRKIILLSVFLAASILVSWFFFSR